MRQNSLKGLQQYNKALYGHGRCRQVASTPSTATDANTADSPGTFILNDKGSLEPGGVEIEAK